MPQSVLRDVFQVQLTNLIRLVRSATRTRLRAGRDAVADDWREKLNAGEVKNRAGLARRTGVSRVRITQVLGPVG